MKQKQFDFENKYCPDCKIGNIKTYYFLRNYPLIINSEIYVFGLAECDKCDYKKNFYKLLNEIKAHDF